MLKGQEGTHKHQHYHIKAGLTKSKCLAHTISPSSVWLPCLFHSFHSFTRTVQLVFTYLLLTNLCRHTPKHILPHWTQHTQTTDISHEHCVDSRRQLCSPLLQCNNRSDFTLVSYSLTAFSSLRLPVVFPFEADLISHIRTSIFLKEGWVRLLWSLSPEKTQTCTTSHPEEGSYFPP